MASRATEDNGHDLAQGVLLSDFGDRPLLRGHVGKNAVLLARVGDEIFAVGASCTHYSGPLDEGVLVGDTIRCPWHHACFSLRSGEALAAPAFDPLPCWKVEREADRIVVRQRTRPEPEPLQMKARAGWPEKIVIIGGGAAGFACAQMLRRRGYEGRLTMLSDDPDAPYDRPNLSKDYLAGEAPEEWMPLRSGDFYRNSSIDLQPGVTVTQIDTAARNVTTSDRRTFPFDRLLLATGAEPVSLPVPGAKLDHVFTLRSMADCRRIIERARTATTAVILGSGFIGLETAAALRSRGLNVHVVSLDERPLEKVLGPELGDFIRQLHEQHGVNFHMGSSLADIAAEKVTLSDGREIDADLVIIGVGVRPRLALAQSAGLRIDKGVLVNSCLETSSPDIFAAGDVARWHDAGSGEMLRIEHWVVAERHGQTVAENMLGARKPFQEVPFFWSAHYDVAIRYVGHALSWDAIEIDGDIAAHDCRIDYRKEGRIVAVATIGRDQEALTCEVAMEEKPSRLRPRQPAALPHHQSLNVQAGLPKIPDTEQKSAPRPVFRDGPKRQRPPH